MPKIETNGVNLFYDEAGSGTPLLFLHEFAGDWRSWEPQMRFFSRRYRAITYSVRGYHPSDVPEQAEAYSQQQQVDDLGALMDGLKIEQAHLCGLSMGSFTALLFASAFPGRVLSLTIAGSAYGSGEDRERWQKSVTELGKVFLAEGLGKAAEDYAIGAARVQFQNKDPRGWEEFKEQFLTHSPVGSAHTFLRIQAVRPSLFDMEKELRALQAPALILLGDEDMPGLEGSLFMKAAIPRAGLEIFPRTGHVLNLEEPDRFNRSVLEFITAVDAGRWEPRDPRSLVE